MNLVVPVDGLQDGSNFVVAVIPTAEDTQFQINLANARNSIESSKEIRFQNAYSKQQPQRIEGQRTADKPEGIDRSDLSTTTCFEYGSRRLLNDSGSKK
jgi:hypothetical protein